MHLLLDTLLFAMLLLALFGPVLLGFTISAAIAGKGYRLIWIAISVPLFIGMCALLNWAVSLVKSTELRNMLGVAAFYAAAWLLVPMAQALRRWRQRRKALQELTQDKNCPTSSVGVGLSCFGSEASTATSGNEDP